MINRKKTAEEKILININDSKICQSKLAILSGVTQAYTVKVIRRLLEKGLIEKRKMGRLAIYFVLTEKGREVRETYIKLNEAYNKEYD